jgi:RND family efflux transporter MFP subunit
MVIYVREWNGKKKGVGSQWQPWDPSVATLPDLTQMESETYVNEVDVRKLALGQKVQISLDADPAKKLSGTVTHIANVGEQRPNQDSKVFEVKIDIATRDTTLRPGMTTANAIEVASVQRAMSVPLEAVVNDGGFSYVFKKDGRSVVRQMVETGEMNDNEIVVRRGVSAGDRVLLTPPADRTGVETVVIPGLRPITAPVAGGDTAKNVKAPTPAPRPAAGPSAAPTPAAVASKH